MFRAAMPEATINVDGNARGGEQDVSGPPSADQGSSLHPEP